MSGTVREGTFYPVFPYLDSKPLNLQWGISRSNTAETKAIVRNSVQELEDGVDELNALRALLGQEYGDLDFRNRFRFFYDSDTTELCCQKNDGTVDSPTWTDSWCIRLSDGQFQSVSEGGIWSSAGFYTDDDSLVSIREVAESGTSADVSISYPTKLFFNADDGFGVEEISSGANEGQPEIRFTQPFGKAEQFTKSGKMWQVDHNFGISPVLVQVMDNDDRIVIPDKADLSDPNTAYFYFDSVFSGSVYIASGGVGATSLVPRDPFYLVVRTDEMPASPNNTLKPNADIIFDSNLFYVNVDLDDDAGGAHKTARISLTNTVTLPDHGSLSGLSDDDHTQYALVDGSRDFTGHVRMDDTLNVENSITAEAFYLQSGSGGEIYKDGNDVVIASTLGQVVIADELYVEGKIVAENFYIKSGGDVSDHGSLNGLSDDDHTQYALADGSRAFSGPVTLDNSADSTNILYIDSGLTSSQDSAIYLQDQGSTKWILNKLSTNSFILYDAVEGISTIFVASHSDNEYAIGINSGNVGIGTASPSKKLHVVGEGYFEEHVRMDDTLNVENSITAEAFYLQSGSGGEIYKDGNDVVIKSSCGQVVIDDELLVSGKIVAENFYITDGGFVNSLRIREQDGTPDVRDIGDIIVGNGALTDNGDGTVTLATGTGGGINIKDENNIYLGPDNLTFANKDFYLTSDSNGHPVTNLQPIEHDTLTGLSNDDHTQYALADGSRAFSGHVRMDDTLNVENAVTAEVFYLQSGDQIYSNEGNLVFRSSSGRIYLDDDVKVTNSLHAEAFYLIDGGGLFKDTDDLIIDVGGSGNVEVRTNLHVGDQDATGDSVIDFHLGGVLQFRLGIDDSDSDSFKIANSNGFGSGDLFRLNQAGKLTLEGPVNSVNVQNVRAEAFYFKSGGEAPQSYVESFTSAVEWEVNHNLNRPHFIAQAYKGTGELLTPDAVYTNDRNTAYFYFSSNHAGKAVIFGVG